MSPAYVERQQSTKALGLWRSKPGFKGEKVRLKGVMKWQSMGSRFIHYWSQFF
jgi:hypothetical protein